MLLSSINSVNVAGYQIWGKNLILEVTVSQWRENLYDENLELPFEVSNESTLAAFFSETVL